MQDFETKEDIEKRLQATFPAPLLDRYSIKDKLGSGSYGVVRKAVDKLTGEVVAIKQMQKVFQNTTDAKRTLRELSIVRRCSHPNVIRLLNAHIPDETDFNDVWCVFEFRDYSLSRLIAEARNVDVWCADHVKHLLYGILCGMRYLHSANIIHRDLKPANIMTSQECHVKIIDFGLAREYADEEAPPSFIHNGRLPFSLVPSRAGAEKNLTQHVVTRWYRAPELLLMERNYSAKIDVWSVGCIFAELLMTLDKSKRPAALFRGAGSVLTGNHNKPRDAAKVIRKLHDPTSQLRKIFNILGNPGSDELSHVSNPTIRSALSQLGHMPTKPFEHILPFAAPEALDLLKRMLRFAPSDRISIDDALEHPYLRPIRNRVMEATSEFPLHFDFESERLSQAQLRAMIVDELVAISAYGSDRTRRHMAKRERDAMQEKLKQEQEKIQQDHEETVSNTN
eukprot:TRINITY_DN1926_c0_g2_i3.p1 TRINITY_DN1926_c0_g2~~TRINITY_DN1926_c0_g2_i3.p1  ORF type:complete len:452 (+),score=127.31 TRINITY_DN1926_c0_g2_i3:39-1394(+)